MITLTTYNEEAVRAVAHQIWEEEGRPDGRHDIHWQWALERVQPTTLAAPVTAAAASDVSLIDGVGPKITAQLAAEGITTLAQIAKLSAVELADLDTALNLKGRTSREDWIAQAKELLAGKAPRAKVDQAKLSKKK
jgi:large subunit ribosomal protein L21